MGGVLYQAKNKQANANRHLLCRAGDQKVYSAFF
jgi:hypothetical protein